MMCCSLSSPFFCFRQILLLLHVFEAKYTYLHLKTELLCESTHRVFQFQTSGVPCSPQRIVCFRTLTTQKKPKSSQNHSAFGRNSKYFAGAYIFKYYSKKVPLKKSRSVLWRMLVGT